MNNEPISSFVLDKASWKSHEKDQRRQAQTVDCREIDGSENNSVQEMKTIDLIVSFFQQFNLLYSCKNKGRVAYI